MSDEQIQFLKVMAARYIWWQPPEAALARPLRLIVQIMDIGDYADVQAMTKHFDTAYLIEALNTAGAGQLSPRSWSYWHYRLGLCASDQVPPPLPQRAFG